MTVNGDWLMRIINDSKLKYKLLFSSSIVIIPVVIIFMIMTIQNYRLSTNNMIDLSKSAASQLSRNIESELQKLYEVSENLLNEGTLRKYVSTIYTDDYTSYRDFITNVLPILNSVLRNNNNVYLYSNNNTLRFSRVTNNGIDDLERMSWYNGLQNANIAVWGMDINRYKLRQYSFGYYRSISLRAAKTYPPQDIQAALAVFLAEDELYSLISEEAESGKIIYLYDRQGQIITSTNRNMLGMNISEANHINTDIASAGQNRRVKIDNKQYLAFSQLVSNPTIGLRDLHLLYYVPIEATVSSMYRTITMNILIGLVCLVISYILSLLISMTITRRVDHLSKTARHVLDLDFAVPVAITGKDEIGMLETSIDIMLKKLQSLINDIYVSELRYKEIELQKKESDMIALQSQINPHYLMNTLEAIKMSIVLKRDQNQISEILTAFGNSFRLFTDMGISDISLRDELDFLHNYIMIQQFIFEGEILFKFDVSSNVLEDKIPKLLLQPIVENAINHGIVPRGSGCISVNIFLRDDQLFIEIQDDGIGMQTNTLYEIMQYINSQKMSSEDYADRIALKNIFRRLWLRYGDLCKMDVISDHQGTLVRIIIPRG